jgi:hypothetical protein
MLGCTLDRGQHPREPPEQEGTGQQDPKILRQNTHHCQTVSRNIFVQFAQETVRQVLESSVGSVGSYLCCGSGMFIPDPESEFFPSRIPGHKIPESGCSKEFEYFNPKNCF